MSEINCLKCRSLWIGLAFALLGSVLIGLVIFDSSFYGENFFFFFNLVRFAIVGSALFGFIIGSYFLMREFCFKDGGLDVLAGGIVCIIGMIAMIMLLIYFVPMAYEEAVLRSIDSDDDRMIYAQTMNCRSILWHDHSVGWTSSDNKIDYDLRFDEDWSNTFRLSSIEIDNKIKECKWND